MLYGEHISYHVLLPPLSLSSLFHLDLWIKRFCMNYESHGFVGGEAANEYAGTRLRDLKNIQIERSLS